MTAFVMDNSQPHLKCIVFTPDDLYHRPVASISKEGVTQQCVVKDDLIVSADTKGNISVTVHDSSVTLNDGEVKAMLDYNVSAEDMAFLTNESIAIPTNRNWNGVDTINSLAFKYGLDKFLTGIANTAILGGIMGLTPDFESPSVGCFDINQVLNNKPLDLTKIDMDQSHKLVTGVEREYVDWLLNDCISSPLKTLNWRSAERLPDMLSVSCIMNKGHAIRFNDLIVWRGVDSQPEIISIFDIVNTFTMDNTNFLSMPYVIDEDVTRIMYIVHGDNIAKESDNVAWLYRRR